MPSIRVAVVLATALSILGGSWSSATAAAPVATPTCHAGDLHLRAVGGRAAGGSYAETFVVHNVGKGSCSVLGHPSVRLESAIGGHLPGQISYGGSALFHAGASESVVLPQGGQVSFDISSVTTGEQPCDADDSAVVAITVFGDSRPVVTAHRTLPYCPSDRQRVSNFAPGSSGPPSQ